MATDLDIDQNTLGQIIRFGIVGLFLTGLYSVIYWPLAEFAVHPVLAVVIAFAVAVSVGFVLHSRWSFKGHGKEESGATRLRFFISQTFGFFLNIGFTWFLTGPMHGPTWWPLIPVILVTPLATFLLNRFWVFG